MGRIFVVVTVSLGFLVSGKAAEAQVGAIQASATIVERVTTNDAGMAALLDSGIPDRASAQRGTWVSRPQQLEGGSVVTMVSARPRGGGATGTVTVECAVDLCFSEVAGRQAGTLAADGAPARAVRVLFPDLQP
ncbi:MAG: hypothetical protein WEF86_11950 [Gemmatimonadota bacterium]